MWETEDDDVRALRGLPEVRLRPDVLGQLHVGQVFDVLVALVDDVTQIASQAWNKEESAWILTRTQ